MKVAAAVLALLAFLPSVFGLSRHGSQEWFKPGSRGKPGLPPPPGSPVLPGPVLAPGLADPGYPTFPGSRGKQIGRAHV